MRDKTMDNFVPYSYETKAGIDKCQNRDYRSDLNGNDGRTITLLLKTLVMLREISKVVEKLS